MKSFAMLAMIVLFAAVAGLFFIKTPDGTPILELSDIAERTRDGASTLRREGRDAVIGVRRKLGDDDAGTTEVYRWRDDEGQWHYSDEAPADREAQRVRIDPETSRVDVVGRGETPQ